MNAGSSSIILVVTSSHLPDLHTNLLLKNATVAETATIHGEIGFEYSFSQKLDKEILARFARCLFCRHEIGCCDGFCVRKFLLLSSLEHMAKCALHVQQFPERLTTLIETHFQINKMASSSSK